MTTPLEQAFALHKAGDFLKAESAYKVILEKEPQNAAALFLLGTLLCQERNFEDAIMHLQSSLEINPQLDEAYNSLGRAYLGLNKIELAEESFSKIAFAKKPNASALNSLGILREKQNRKKDAVAMFRNAILVHPIFLDAHLNLAQNLMGQGKFPEAQKACREALKLFPDDFSVLVLLGNIQKRAGQLEKAEDSYHKALLIHPKNITVLHHLALVLKDLKKLEASLECYSQIETLGAPTVDILFDKALTLKEMGLLKEALACYDEAIKQKPDLAEAHLYRGQLLLQLESC